MGAAARSRPAVLDPELRVRGVRGLSVADASAFPSLTTVNPVVTVLMLAERAAEADRSPWRGCLVTLDAMARLSHPRTPTWSSTMTVHRRIRPFNTRDTYPEQNLNNDLSQAVVAGDTIYLRGQVGQDHDTSENVGIGDVEAQAEQAMKNIKQLLEEAGGTLEHIVRVTVYLVDPRYRETVYRVMGRWLTGVHPVSAGIVVSALARPEWLVEIDATAVRGGEHAA